MRVDVHYVVNTVFASAAPDARAVRWLHPMPGASTPEDEARLAEFAAYLAGKSRAGVIKLDPSHSQPPSEGQGGAAAAAAAAVTARCGPLALYLVPPSSPVCGALGVPWDGQQQQLRQGGRSALPLLLALVVPQQAAPMGAAPEQLGRAAAAAGAGCAAAGVASGLANLLQQAFVLALPLGLCGGALPSRKDGWPFLDARSQAWTP
eukprot:275414-Pelagomonas_calceolata.AAC.2